MPTEPIREEIDENGDQPVTKKELNDAINTVVSTLDSFATKDDLKKLETALGKKLDEWGNKIIKHHDETLDAAVENRFLDLGAAKREEAELMRQQVEEHAERIKSLKSA